MAAQLCPLLGLNEETTETVVWLIRHHLLMSKTAFRYDLNDPQTISDFAAEVQSPERLKLLLVLTVADILAVGPEIWNGWKASLMRDLYSRSEAVLGGAAPSEVSAVAAADAMQATRRPLAEWEDERFDAHAQLFYPSYWTNFSTESHLHHARLAEQFNAGEKKLLIDFKIDDDKESTILVVMAADHPGLFSRIVGAVAVAGCSIMNARINTRHDGTILDQFRIQDKDRQAVTDPQVQNRIAKIIEQSLAGDISLFGRLQERSAQITKRQKAMSVPPRVIVSNNRSNTHTVIEVNGADRPGLLYQITYHLVQLGLQINSATASTYGEKVVDVFYVKDVYGLKIEKEASQTKIKQTLMGVFDLQKAEASQNRTTPNMASRSLFAAFRQISGLTAISRVLGFIRDVVFAHYLGAGAATDAFLVAFKLPNLFRRLTAEGALTNAFLPSYSLARQQKSDKAALILAAEVQTALFLGLSLIVLVMEVFMPLVVAGLAPGFADTPDRLAAAVDLARLTMPYLPMISLVALWAAVLNSHDSYFGGAFAPVILNACLIGGGAFCVPFFQAQS